ncbi:MAG: glycoside hydrolase family 2 protein, partial [Chryseobacterium sp.]
QGWLYLTTVIDLFDRKVIKLTKPKIKIQKVSSFQIQVSTDVYAKDVYLMGDNHFSDNFFDLFPNDSRIITFSKPMDNFEVMSLWDTMNN